MREPSDAPHQHVNSLPLRESAVPCLTTTVQQHPFPIIMPATHENGRVYQDHWQQAPQVPQLQPVSDIHLQPQSTADGDLQASLELAAFLQKFEKLAQKSDVAKDVLSLLDSNPTVRNIRGNKPFRFRLLQNHEDYDPHPSSNKLELTLEIAKSFYDGEIIGEVEVQMRDHTYLPYNDPSGEYTMNCRIEVAKRASITVYHISLKNNKPNVIKNYLNVKFDTRFCRVCFRKLTTREVIAYSNHFEMVSNDGRSLRNAKKQRLW